MSKARMFAMGVIILCLGAQLRIVDTFVLNEKATKIVNKRLASRAEASSTELTDPYFAPPPPQQPTKRGVSPPRWLAYSFLSIGAVLVLTCPLRGD